MELNLSGKKALITGASYGLGYACARTLSMEGADVVLCSRNSEHVLAAVNSIKLDSNNSIFGIVADLTQKIEINRLLFEAKKHLGKIDILVVCTGHPPTYPFSKATDDHWSQGLDLVLQPAIRLTRGVVEDMKEFEYGRIIYIGSVFGLEPEVSSVIQSTFRTGLNAFSKCVATEYASQGITANVICPGYFNTPLCTELAKKYSQETGKPVEEILKSWGDIAPIQKFGDPEDLGSLVAFLSSPKAKFITGTSIAIDGGFLRQY